MPPSKNRPTQENLSSYPEDGHAIWIKVHTRANISVMKFNKPKHRSVATDDHLAAVLRIATTEMMPDFNSLVNAHQRFYSSH